MDIPADIAILSTIKPGSVFYFKHENFSAPYPHYFILINHNPVSDTSIFLVCATSKVQKCRKWYSACPPETLVLLDPGQYSDFKVKTIINCNEVIEITIKQLVRKRKDNSLILKPPMSAAIVDKLRKGVIASPTVERRIKVLLK